MPRLGLAPAVNYLNVHRLWSRICPRGPLGRRNQLRMVDPRGLPLRSKRIATLRR